MSVNAEKRQEILQLLATGKISVDEAADMLSGQSEPETLVEKQPATEADLDDLIKVEQDPGTQYAGLKQQAKAENATGNGSDRPSWLRVRVSDMKTGRNKVTVNVPMRLVRFGLAVGSRFSPELGELDLDELNGFLGSERGMLVDVQDEEDGEHVQIFVD